LAGAPGADAEDGRQVILEAEPGSIDRLDAALIESLTAEPRGGGTRPLSA
jgi:hypothetical protein